MKNAIKLIFVITFLLPVLSLTGRDQVFLIQGKELALQLRNGEFGLQHKIGTVDDVVNNPVWRDFSFGIAEDTKIQSADFKVIHAEEKKTETIHSVLFRLKHKRLPLEIEKEFSAHIETGVITHKTTLVNVGEYAIHMENTPSLDYSFLPGNYRYSWLTSAWSKERIIKDSPLDDKPFLIESKHGRSSARFSPWIHLHDTRRDLHYIVQLAWSGNWRLNLEQDKLKSPNLSMGEYYDNGRLVLRAGHSHELPCAVITAAKRNMDNAANNLHRYQTRCVLPAEPENMKMPVQFNTWFPLLQNVNVENLKQYADKASELGCEVFIIDAGWYVKKEWRSELGDWETNREGFPDGMREIADHVRSRGMQFGIWLELESVGTQSDLFNKHPEWCLQYNGAPVFKSPRRHLDFSKPEVFRWASETFARMHQESGGIDWVKLDYNSSVGFEFENSNGIKEGNVLHKHIRAYYQWLDSLRVRYPNLFIENCSSGGLRMDLGMAGHSHGTFISDETSPNPSLGMAWSSTLEFVPRALNHWVVGMGNHYAVIDESLPEGYWDYMFKVPMNGQYGISSLILDWSPELDRCAKKNIETFKRIRSIIAEADCYHLTAQPDYENPLGWTAIHYVEPSLERGVTMVYRTDCDQSTYSLIPKGLNSNRKYHVYIDGLLLKVISGKDLMSNGLEISRPDKYRACVVEYL